MDSSTEQHKVTGSSTGQHEVMITIHGQQRRAARGDGQHEVTDRQSEGVTGATTWCVQVWGCIALQLPPWPTQTS